MPQGRQARGDTREDAETERNPRRTRGQQDARRRGGVLKAPWGAHWEMPPARSEGEGTQRPRTERIVCSAAACTQVKRLFYAPAGAVRPHSTQAADGFAW